MSKLFEIEDSELAQLNLTQLNKLEKRMKVKYRVNALRAKGIFREDILFHMNDRIDAVQMYIRDISYARQLRGHFPGAIKFETIKSWGQDSLVRARPGQRFSYGYNPNKAKGLL